MSDFYLTTPIYYVNDLPHIGHIYTTLVADTIARYRRLSGDRVYFLTGTDEHGQKIERAAEEQGVTPLALADRVVERYHQLWQQTGLTHDDFIRTSEERHKVGVREVIGRIAASDDFYVDRHEGWYCVLCETFYTDKEVLPGNLCPVHETPLEKKSEENVFFRLSKYQEPLLRLYDEHPEFVRPASRLNEVRQFVAQGLKDLSVSRTSVEWGVPFPNHEGHTVYVWLDALSNYVTALGFGAEEHALYDTFWDGADTRIHLVGKDILRFHAVYWPAFLMSAGLPLPTTVWAHGWWQRDNKKISKSVGNVARPDHLLEDFGAEALRYYLLRDMVFGQDASYSDEAFVERYNSDLANDLGNSVSRLVTLSRKAFDDHLPPTAGDGLAEAAAEAVETYRRSMDAFAFRDALEALSGLIQETSQYLVRNQPWKKMNDEEARDDVSAVLWSGLEAVRIVASALLPVLPEKAPAVLRSIGAPVPETLAQDAEGGDPLAWGGLPTSAELGQVEPLFPRIDKAKYLAGLAGDDAAASSAQKQAEPKKKKAKKSKGLPEPKEQIDIGQFFETALKVAEVKAVERVPKSDKLLQITVDSGDPEPRTVVAGLGKHYEPEDLVGKSVVVVANLAPAKLMGIESNGMILAASHDGTPVLLHPAGDVPPGTRVK
ncbi:MAG: methionine--tRNA ligase [Acidobacteriota bacterium]